MIDAWGQVEHRRREHRRGKRRRGKHRRRRSRGGLWSAVKLRDGLTLVELLVVIAILAILTSATIGALRPAVAGQQVRESARLLQSTLSAAQSRAAEIGRPAGVLFEPLPDGLASLTLVPVESPPPFGGFATGDRIRFTAVNASGALATVTVSFVNAAGQPLTYGLSTLLDSGVITVGDRLQLNYRGNRFLITAASGSTLTLRSEAVSPRWPSTSVAYPFLFHRRPRPSADAPVTLPGSAVVDLTLSGGSNSGSNLDVFQPNTGTPITLTFLPSGRLDRIYHPGSPLTVAGEKFSAPVHFLIGRSDQVDDVAPLTDSQNLFDLNNLWVSVSAETGMIGTFEMADVANDPNVGSGATLNDLLESARRFVRTGIAMGK
ncbi:MAG: prepilin-type N-terminal cleavage/methylation domain-containing protein [Planctomycetota bacterium]|nr:MAG: prepilin-type N-terminal cleavage/methylation domain-containing protein [Planctomycetota bacterium]REK22300.1 MAG: prepilin-type N-terminal cleavage/methylation domain-containing protein [Planctomycetota bacterium]REK41071.1 MAG: prepilin-type N-terminal cleavage/methylation domain-containing protein [Planctomycetota bacterium]